MEKSEISLLESRKRILTQELAKLKKDKEYVEAMIYFRRRELRRINKEVKLEK